MLEAGSIFGIHQSLILSHFGLEVWPTSEVLEMSSVDATLVPRRDDNIPLVYCFSEKVLPL